MAAISQTIFSDASSFCILIKISLKFVPKGAITPTPYMVLPLFVTSFAAYAGGIRVSFIQPRLF